LGERAIPYVVAEENRELVEGLHKTGIAAVSGNAADPAVLIQAHIADAAMLVIATPDTLHVRQMAETARALNPDIEILLRTTTRKSPNCCATSASARFSSAKKSSPTAWPARR
jgi:monovalent cation:H+ antiporter-2, CPA2 family